MNVCRLIGKQCKGPRTLPTLNRRWFGGPIARIANLLAIVQLLTLNSSLKHLFLHAFNNGRDSVAISLPSNQPSTSVQCAQSYMFGCPLIRVMELIKSQ